MNTLLLQASREFADQTGMSFEEALNLIRPVWTMLTGQPVIVEPSLEDFAREG